MANKYWLGGERIGCWLCELGIDTLEHAAKECEDMWRWEGDIAELLAEEGEGYCWIREWIGRRNEAENDKQRQRSEFG